MINWPFNGAIKFTKILRNGHINTFNWLEYTCWLRLHHTWIILHLVMWCIEMLEWIGIHRDGTVFLVGVFSGCHSKGTICTHCYIKLRLSVSVCLSVCMSVCFSVLLCVCLCVCQYIYAVYKEVLRSMSRCVWHQTPPTTSVSSPSSFLRTTTNFSAGMIHFIAWIYHFPILQSMLGLAWHADACFYSILYCFYFLLFYCRYCFILDFGPR